MKNIFIYSIKDLFKRWSFILTIVIGLITNLFVVYGQSYLSKDGFLNSQGVSGLLTSQGTYQIIFSVPSFIVLSLLSVVCIYYIFIIDSKSTIELFTRTMPIKRSSVFIARILTYLLVMLSFILLWFVFSFLLTFFDKEAPTIYRTKYALSILIGSLVVFAFISGIALLFSIFLVGRTFFITLTIIILGMPLFTLVNSISFKTTFTPQHNFYSLDKSANPKNLYHFDETRQSVSEDYLWNKYKPGAYKILNKIDLFDKFANLYSWLYFSEDTNAWYSKDKMKITSDYKLKINSKFYQVVLLSNALSPNDEDTKKRYIGFVAKKDALVQEIIKNKAVIKGFSIEQMFYFLEQILDQMTLTKTLKQVVNDAVEKTQNTHISTLRIAFANITGSLLKMYEIIKGNVKDNFTFSDSSSLKIPDYINSNVVANIRLAEENAKFDLFIKHEDINYDVFIAITVLLGILLAATKGITYTKKKRYT